jgi:4'-phosphopantetheinyl transferase
MTDRDAPPALLGPWRPAPSGPSLSRGVVHVWRADLRSVTDELPALLTGPELRRAEAPEPAARSTQRLRRARARAVLRDLLGRYGAGDPRRIELVTGEHGKPAVAGGLPPSFNLSHSGDLALYAFARELPLGIDVELGRGSVRAPGLAARVLGEDEAARLAGLQPPERDAEFLRAWARHEAVGKCRGIGIGGTRAEHTTTGGEIWLAGLDVGPGAAAALAVAGAPGEVLCFEWPPPA